MTDRLKGKTAIITAAGQGIGEATARLFAAQGARVIATDINSELLAQLEPGTNIETSLLDIHDAGAIAGLFQQETAADILFNCAGMVQSGTILDCSEDDWELGFSMNVRSMYYMIKAALPNMIARGGGSIINMSSVASSVKGVPQRFVYGATKAAVIGLTKSVAADYVTQNIRCNAICPGTVDTPSLQQRINESSDPEGSRTQFLARQPMGRLGTAQEIAALALYLASDESAYTTGVAHVIDGGWSI